MLLLLQDANTLKLQLHYYFEDETRHSMDAYVRNDNERDVLAILKKTVDLLGVDVKIEAIPGEEGGLIDKYKVTAKNIGVATVLIMGFGLYFQWDMNRSQKKANESQIELNESQINVNESQVKVNESQIRLNNLQIEALEIEKQKKQRELRKKLKELDSDSDTLKLQKKANTLAKDVADTLSLDYKAIWHRSKFFDRSFKTTNKIDRVTTQAMDENDTPLEKERGVDRSSFRNFILKSNAINSLIDKEAIIEIISPVLKGKFTWKGTYKGEVITFHMLDKLFVQKIESNEVKFGHGTTIKCVLEQTRKIDDTTGLIKILKNNVLSVAPMDDKNKVLQVPRRARGSVTQTSQLNLSLTSKKRNR